MKKKYKIIGIIPVFNEGEKVKKVVEEIPEKLIDEIVVVDDGSDDENSKIIKELNVKVLKHKKNQGVGAAIRSGLYYGLKNKFDIAVILSGSGKTPPYQIPKLLEPLYNGYEFVQGSRYLEGGSLINAPAHRSFGTRGYTTLFTLLSFKKITDASSGFRAFFLKILEDKRINLRQNWLKSYELEPYLLFKVLKLNYRFIEVPVQIVYPEGKKNYTKMMPFLDWWKIFRPLLFLSLKIKK